MDRSRRAVDRQWRDLLDEIEYLLRVLRDNGHKAHARLTEAVAYDGYPTSSMPENSSVASGRVGNPTADTVVRYAGGKLGCAKCRGKGVINGQPCSCVTSDTWDLPYDPIGMSVTRMESQLTDAWARLATAEATSIGDDSSRTAPEGFHLVLKMCDLIVIGLGELDMKALIGQPRNYIESQTLDARNRLRTAVSALNDALPKMIPEPTREQCQKCGVSKWVITAQGRKPRQWIVSESKCRECVERPKRVAKGRAS